MHHRHFFYLAIMAQLWLDCRLQQIKISLTISSVMQHKSPGGKLIPPSIVRVNSEDTLYVTQYKPVILRQKSAAFMSSEDWRHTFDFKQPDCWNRCWKHLFYFNWGSNTNRKLLKFIWITGKCDVILCNLIDILEECFDFTYFLDIVIVNQ